MMSFEQMNDLRNKINSSVIEIKILSNILGVEQKSIMEVIENGSLPATKLGKKYFISENDIYKFFGINVKVGK